MQNLKPFAAVGLLAAIRYHVEPLCAKSQAVRRRGIRYHVESLYAMSQAFRRLRPPAGIETAAAADSAEGASGIT